MQLVSDNSKSKYWCWTLNNPTEAETANIKSLQAQMQYLVYGDETGESGTKHFQGFVCFKNRKTFRYVKKNLPRAHIEKMRGTIQEASDYCKKDGKVYEYGIAPLDRGVITANNNKRKWEEAFEHAKKDELEMIEKGMLIRYYHAFKRIKQDNPIKVAPLQDVCGIWLYGAPGVGKSHKARVAYDGTMYDKPLNKWWDGYQNEDNILLDDIGTHEAEWMGTHLKRWADKYPFPAEQKGTTIQIRPKLIIVTSNYSIDTLFATDFSLKEAIKRRFKEEHMENRYEEEQMVDKLLDSEDEVAESLLSIVEPHTQLLDSLYCSEELSSTCTTTEIIDLTQSQ